MTESSGICCVHCRHSTQYTFQLLTASILAYSKKRNYGDYKARRTAGIWASREELIAYEDALKLEAEVDDPTTDGRGRKDTPIEPGAIGDKLLFPLLVEHVLNFEGQTGTRNLFAIG